MDCVQRALDDAKLKPAEIDKRRPRRRQHAHAARVAICSRSGSASPLISEVNPDLCVAMGAAVQAGAHRGHGRRSGARRHHAALARHQVARSISDGFGRRIASRRSFDRNTPLPGSRSECSSRRCRDHQKEVEIEVYQGENDDVRFNHQLGDFRIEGLAKVPAGNQIVTVQFDLNLDGILKVSAREKATGLQKHVTIENALQAIRGGPDSRVAGPDRRSMGGRVSAGRRRGDERVTADRGAGAGPRARRKASARRCRPAP